MPQKSVGAVLPEIRIYFADLLYRGESRHLDMLFNKGQSKLFDFGHYKKRAESYKEAWAPYEQKILLGLADALGVRFYRPVIDAPVAPYFHPKSTPLILNFYPEPDEFIDVLTHELIHVLLTDNTKYQEVASKSKFDYRKLQLDLFGEHEVPALVHIPVHALHKYIYLDVLKAPERLQRDIDNIKARSNEPYIKAWSYVNTHDYKQIIQSLKKAFAQL